MLDPVDRERNLQRGMKLSREIGRVARPIDDRLENYELVAAEARYRVALAKLFAQTQGDADQHLIADGMPRSGR